jgi:hypothetical protein
LNFNWNRNRINATLDTTGYVAGPIVGAEDVAVTSVNKLLQAKKISLMQWIVFRMLVGPLEMRRMKRPT